MLFLVFGSRGSGKTAALEALRRRGVRGLALHDFDTSMRWERWADWREGDPRWRVRAVDTTALGIDEVADALRAWVDKERGDLRP